MARTTYHQFDIVLKIEGNKLTLVHATDAECVIPNFDGFIVECNQRLDEEFETIQSQKENGQFLFDTLFPPGQPLRNSFTKALKENECLRLRVLYPPDLDDNLLKIPWEYLYVDPEKPENLSGFLCQRSNFSLVHCLKEPTGGSALANKESFPLKVSFLSAFDNPEDALENIKGLIEDNSTVTEEYSSIIRISKHADKIQLSDFRSALKNDEVAQFLIHGSADAIYLNGTGGELKGTEILSELEDVGSHKIRVVVLCACDGAQKKDGPSINLHKKGIPVVIGFTKTFNTKKAIRFMEDFYSELASTAGNVEEALAFARTGLIHKDDGFFATIAEDTQLSLDWGIPRIFLSVANGDLIPEELLYTPVYKMGKVFEKELKKRLDKAPQKDGAPNIPDYPIEIDEWRKGSQRILYLYGSSGSGKSTQIARFIQKHKNDRKILYHFCALRGKQADEENANHTLVFVRDSLYPQLETLFGKEQYRLWVGHHYPYLINNPKDALQQLVIEPLRRARNSSKWKQPILIIDGLDRANAFKNGGYTILNLLSDYIQPLTEVVRLLITATSEKDQSEVHQRLLGLLGENDRRGESLKMPVTVDWQEIREEINGKLPENLKSVFNEFLEKMENAGQINYQFINFITRITDPALMEKIIRGSRPGGDYLKFAYETTWNYLRDHDKDRKDQVERLLKVVGIAYAPLPESMLAALVNIKEDQIRNLLDKSSCFITEEDGEVSCEHPSIKDFLESLDSADNSHKLFLDMYLRQTDNGRQWDQFDRDKNTGTVDYAAHYFAEHAYRYYIEGREKDFENGMNEYLKLMLAPGFRNFRKRNAGDSAAIEDVRRILRVYYIKWAIDNLKSEVKGFVEELQNLIFRRKTISADNIWRAGNHLLATPAIEQILDTSGRYNNPQLVTLEKKLCNSNEQGDFEPLKQFWSLYYPSLFHRSSGTS